MKKILAKLKEVALSKDVLAAEGQLARVVARRLIASGVLTGVVAALLELWLRH